MSKYIIFGAGPAGKELLNKIDINNVAFFCDNDEQKVGKEINGIRIISFEEMVKQSKQYIVIIASGYKYALRLQLESAGIQDYILYEADIHKKNDLKQVIKNGGYRKDKFDLYLDELVLRTEKVDMINDFDSFKGLVKECKNKRPDGWINYSYYRESDYYGHGATIMDYANIDDSKKWTFPVLPHYVRLPVYDYPEAVMFASKCEKEEHNTKYPYIPTYDIGQCISYATGIIDSNELQRIRTKNGRTCLLFVTHSEESVEADFLFKGVKKDLEDVWLKEYDHVIMSVYWYDADLEMYQSFMEMGVQLVSSGFRHDRNFLRRLRTYMDMSDTIVSYGMSSAVPHALALKKHLVYREDRTVFSNKITSYTGYDDNFNTGKEYDQRWEIIKNKMGLETQELTEMEQRIINDSFGINIKRTPEEIRLFCDICRDIWEECDYERDHYPIGVYRTYNKYQKNNDWDKLGMFSYCVGQGFLAM